MKALYVEWMDSNSLGGPTVWHPKDSKPGDLMCQTVGFVMHEDKKTITLAAHLSDTDSMSGDITIPQRAITKRRIVRWKK